VGLAVPHLERLALSVNHRQARNGHFLASCRLSFVSGPGRCGAANPDDRSFRARSEISSARCAGRIPLGCTPRSRRTAQTRHRHRGEQRQQIHGALPQSAVSDLAHFLENHAKQLVSIDFFTVPTIHFQVLYVFLVLAMTGVAFCISM
jgi:hypothetical protein